MKQRVMNKIQYYKLSNKKFHFIVTPDELKGILKDLHHVVVSTELKRIT